MAKKKARLGVARIVSDVSVLPAPVGSTTVQGASRRRQTQRNPLQNPPVAVGTNRVRQNPRISPLGGGDARIRVSHREYIDDIYSGTAMFRPPKWEINPGNTYTFPWLRGIASQYESYIFRKLMFEFVPALGTASDGRITMAIDYDASDAMPADKSDMMSYHGATSSSIWMPTVVSSDSADLQKFGIQRYVHPTSTPPPGDIKTYNVGNLFVFATAATVEKFVGELYVSYVVDLITPCKHTFVDPAESTIVYQAGGVITPIEPLGTLRTVLAGALDVNAPAANQFEFCEPGQYMMEFLLGGTAITNAVPLVVSSAPTKSLGGVINSTSTVGRSSVGINITEVPTRATVNFENLAGTVASLTTRIVPYIYALST